MAQSLKIKIQWSFYSSNKLQDTLKQKEQIESKNILGCLPISAFFYAFKLGIRIIKDAHKRIRIEAKESIKKQI